MPHIKDIESHKKSNRNIYEDRDRVLYSAQSGMEDRKVKYEKISSWFGLVTEVKGSPYHDIDYRRDIFYSGGVCMGCHSHKQNGYGLDVVNQIREGQRVEMELCYLSMAKGKGGVAPNF